MTHGLPKGRRSSNHRLLTFSSFSRHIAHLKSKRPPCREPAQIPGTGARNNKINKLGCLDEDDDDDDDKGIVQADFAFFDPKPDDFHGVKILLQSYLDNEQWDLSGFVDLILDQKTVGTVVKIEGNEDDGLFSVISALNLERYKDKQCILDLKKFLLRVCQDKNVLNYLQLLLGEQAPDVGLLVSQRVVNLPPELYPHLYKALFDEVSWATEDEPTEERRNSFHFKYYLIITKFYKSKHADQRAGPSEGESCEPVIYIKEEDEIFHKMSLWSFTFPLHAQCAATHELRNYRLLGLVMAVEAYKITQFQRELKSMVTD